MKLKQLCSITENSKNKQIILSIKKKLLKKGNISVQELLDTKTKWRQNSN